MTQANIDKIKTIAIPILKEAGVTRSALFGSYVRGEQTDKSDIDMLVEYPKGTTLFDVVDLQDKLEEAFGKKVDLVSYKTIKPRLKQYILAEQIPIL
ncbi:MAG: nucleotidyltransferase family protein [Candidatus Levybacteria bacterium]|nr:nucleotidyltransferase family protein [Candidatus Levybacteria bacterium]